MEAERKDVSMLLVAYLWCRAMFVDAQRHTYHLSNLGAGVGVGVGACACACACAGANAERWESDQSQTGRATETGANTQEQQAER